MPFLINIGVVKTNGITTNGNVDIGASVHNNHTANTKTIGQNQGYGDLSPTLSFASNVNLDPNIIDQGQILTPSAPIVNQI